MKKIISLALAVFMLVALVSCADKKVYDEPPKNFSKAGITITLTEAFKEAEREGCAAAYGTEDVAVFMIKEYFYSFKNENMSLDKYAGFVREANKDRSPSEVSKENGFASIEYSFKNSSDNKTYKYFTAILEGTDAYWCVQFTCEESLYSEYRPHFINWAKTVTFAPKA